MTPLIIVAIVVASQYSPGMMDVVVQNRISGNAWVPLPTPLPPVDGFVAGKDCGRIGEIIDIRPEGTSIWERHMVADCARPGDGTAEWMDENGIGVEVSYETAERWGFAGRGFTVEIGGVHKKCDPEVLYEEDSL